MKNSLIRVRKYLRWAISLVTLAFVLCASEAMAAGSMRCNHRVVDQGMSADEVRKLCGEPATTEDGGNTWIYDFGAGQQLKVVRFVQGNVEFIDERPRN
jgi:hypothetical protein